MIHPEELIGNAQVQPLIARVEADQPALRGLLQAEGGTLFPRGCVSDDVSDVAGGCRKHGALRPELDARGTTDFLCPVQQGEKGRLAQ